MKSRKPTADPLKRKGADQDVFLGDREGGRNPCAAADADHHNVGADEGSEAGRAGASAGPADSGI